MGRQLRVGGMGAPLGLDLGVAFPMGAALGLPAYLVAEFLPDIESAMMTALASQSENRGDDN